MNCFTEAHELFRVAVFYVLEQKLLIRVVRNGACPIFVLNLEKVLGRSNPRARLQPVLVQRTQAAPLKLR